MTSSILDIVNALAADDVAREKVCKAIHDSEACNNSGCNKCALFSERNIKRTKNILNNRWTK